MSETRSWRPAEHGLPDHTTYRCLLPLPGGGLAAGTDYGLVLWREQRWQAFPYPRGARRESRRVESLALDGGALVVVTQKNWYRWPFSGEARGRSFRRDAYGVVIELRAVHATGDGLLEAWADGLRGGDGPRDVIRFATTPEGVFAGTLDGRLHHVDHGELRRFESEGRPAPVRHLAWAHERLWVACGGALHTWDGARWTVRPSEPYGLHVDRDGRLWTLRDGRLHRSVDGAWPEPVELELVRPWTVTSTETGDLWVGCVGSLVQIMGGW